MQDSQLGPSGVLYGEASLYVLMQEHILCTHAFVYVVYTSMYM